MLVSEWNVYIKCSASLLCQRLQGERERLEGRDRVPQTDRPRIGSQQTRERDHLHGPQTFLPQLDQHTTYQWFLAKLKLWARDVGRALEDIGTHSLRRGLASDWEVEGVPNRLRRSHGRWKSESAADGYINESINIQLQLIAVAMRQ